MAKVVVHMLTDALDADIRRDVSGADVRNRDRDITR